MAIIYLRSTDGSDVDDGSTWALAKATLAAALTAAGAGGTVYVSQNHAETQASVMTLTSPGTAASPVRVLCVSDAAEPPTALATTGTVTVTDAPSANITFTGSVYIYGLTISGARGVNLGSTGNTMVFDTCVLKQTAGTGYTSTWGPTSTSSGTHLLVLDNTTWEVGHVNSTIFPNGHLVWRNTASALQGATLSTTLFVPGSTRIPAVILLEGVDLSALGSGKNIINVAQSQALLTLRDCKLGASVNIALNAIPDHGGPKIQVVNCDSADTNYRYHKQTYQGTITHETTIVRTTPTGATDGTTPVSRKMVTTANSKFYSPLVSDPVEFWNETTGSNVTVTIAVVTDNVTLTNAEAWVEVEYLGTSGFPLGNFADDRAADILATPANQTTDATSTWTTTGLTTPVKQELSVTITPQEKGLIRARVHLAKASTTMYFDPLAITGARQFQTSESFQNQPAGGGSDSVFGR